MTCSVVTIQEISVALFLAVTLTMAVHTSYIESYMKMIDSNAECVSEVSHMLIAPFLSYCVQTCLTLGLACKTLSYSESDNKCQISESDTLIACEMMYTKIFNVIANSSMANITRSPVSLINGTTIADNSPHYTSYNVEYAIDGLGEQATTAQTFVSNDQAPFVTVDLGREYLVVYVVMWPFPDSAGYDYAKDMDIRVSISIAGLTDTAALCHSRPGTPTERPETFNCTAPITGRYVRAERTTNVGPYFSITEIEVYGH